MPTDQTKGSKTIVVKHIKPHHTLHCTVLPFGEFKGMMPDPLAVYSKRFMTIG